MVEKLSSKISRMNKIGGLTPKKLPPSDVVEDEEVLLN